MAEPALKYKTKKRRRGALYAPISFVIIVAAMIFGMSVFFKVSHIEVSGNSYYTAEEIIEASGIQEGDNLFFINRFTASSRIFTKLAYIEEAAVTRALPNRVLIEVSESSAVGYVFYQGGYFVIDKNCKVLTEAKATEIEGLIRVDGIDIKTASEGLVLEEENDTGKLRYLSDILQVLFARGMTGDISHIDMSNVASPEFDYLGRFTVRIGRNEDIEYKIELLLASIEQLGADETGIFDLSIDKKAHFSPS